MFVRIGNTPRPYAWGSTRAIPQLLGSPETGEPQAELWLGAHPGSPAVILDPASAGGARTLAEWAPSSTLPYLMKVLAAAGPLSLQAHPSAEQARAGYAREEAAGVSLDDPARNYKDLAHKPELIFALSERFDALCGFRELRQTGELLHALQAAAPAPELADFAARFDDLPEGDFDVAGLLRDAVEWLLGARGAEREAVSRLVTATVTAARARLDAGRRWRLESETVLALAEAYPGDPGIVLSTLLNRVTLSAGEVLYLPAGNIHAYLGGLGIEVMASSDNVLRGGLTQKHVDVQELAAVLDFRPLPVPYLRPAISEPGLEVFRPDVPDFELIRIEPATSAVAVRVTGAAVGLCVQGSATVRGSSSVITLGRGDAVFVTGDEGALSVSGDATVFFAAANDGADGGSEPIA